MAQPTRLLCVFVMMLAAALPAAAQQDPAPRPVPILDNTDLMDLLVKPAYDELQQAIAHPPADRKAWASLYQKAARLAELENLILFRTRAEETRRLEWHTRAATARQASADVAAAALLGLRSAAPADFERVRASFPAVSQACTACHRAFSREAPVIKP